VTKDGRRATTFDRSQFSGIDLARFCPEKISKKKIRVVVEGGKRAVCINRSLTKSSAILCKRLGFSPFFSFIPNDPEFLSISTLPFHLRPTS
jgi:hypothetical protein